MYRLLISYLDTKTGRTGVYAQTFYPESLAAPVRRGADGEWDFKELRTGALTCSCERHRMFSPAAVEREECGTDRYRVLSVKVGVVGADNVVEVEYQEEWNETGPRPPLRLVTNKEVSG